MHFPFCFNYDILNHFLTKSATGADFCDFIQKIMLSICIVHFKQYFKLLFARCHVISRT